MKKTRSAFLRAKIKEKGLSQEYAAMRLGVPASNLRQWIVRGVVPAGVLEPLALLLGISVCDLSKAGVKTAESRRRNLGASDQDTLPLLKNIVEAGVERVTGDELRFLFLQQRTFKQTMSSAFIRELLAHRNAK